MRIQMMNIDMRLDFIQSELYHLFKKSNTILQCYIRFHHTFIYSINRYQSISLELTNVLLSQCKYYTHLRTCFDFHDFDLFVFL